jgi:hypothetical protein
MNLVSKTNKSANGTYRMDVVDGVTYKDLVRIFGEPTYSSKSEDEKCYVIWVLEFDGKLFTIYDWKTYDKDYTMNELTEWHVGTHGVVLPIKEYISNHMNK